MKAKSAKLRLDAGQIEVVDEAVAAVLRRKTPAERIALASGARRTAQALIAGRIRSLHPDWNDEQVHRETALRLNRGTD